jgi:hypothetical protein
MDYGFILAFFLFTVVATCTEDLLIRQIVDNTEDYAEQQFNIFKSKYKKNYTTKEEHDYQFGVFKANLEYIEERNKINKVALKNYKLGCVRLSNRVEPDTEESEESLLFVIVLSFLVVLLVWCMLKRAFGYSVKDAAAYNCYIREQFFDCNNDFIILFDDTHILDEDLNRC